MITAYVDPGLGLLAWQALVAFFIGALFYLRKTREFIVGLFKKCVGVRGDGRASGASAKHEPKTS